MIRGTAATHPPLPRIPAHRFGNAAGLVRWHLTAGRSSFGGKRAIRYDGDGAGRDVFKANQGHGLFALTTLCLAAVTDPRQSLVLSLAYGHDRSDEWIASHLESSRETIRRHRNRGLRMVEDKARALAGEASTATNQTLLPEAA
jgi:hypothetical protein